MKITRQLVESIKEWWYHRQVLLNKMTQGLMRKSGIALLKVG